MLTPLRVLNVLIYIVILIGFANRKKPRVHVPIMAAAFVMDVLLVLYIEFTRRAIEQAIGETTLTMKVHLAASLLVVFLYVGQIITGIKKRRGQPSRWHGKAGVAFLSTRLVNLVTSFLVGG